jgi:hypothetical protein
MNTTFSLINLQSLPKKNYRLNSKLARDNEYVKPGSKTPNAGGNAEPYEDINYEFLNGVPSIKSGSKTRNAGGNAEPYEYINYEFLNGVPSMQPVQVLSKPSKKKVIRLRFIIITICICGLVLLGLLCSALLFTKSSSNLL